jgi:hypothetical protein
MPTTTSSQVRTTSAVAVAGEGGHPRLLWLVFTLSVLVNAVSSIFSVPALVPVGLGVLTTATGVALFSHYRHRR